jgi:hypothetical protein
MHLVDNWQRPAADDINPDALEYLFEKSKPSANAWQQVAGDSNEPVARITPAYIRLQTKVEVLKGALELTNEQLHEAHHKIGMLSAELSRREVMLRELSDYRAKAAFAVGYERQNAMMRERIQELQEIISNGSATVEDRVAPVIVNASNYVVRKTKPKMAVSTLAVNTALVVSFAIAALLTILH